VDAPGGGASGEYLTKLSPSGQAQWTYVAPYSLVEPNAVATDSAGNVFVTGHRATGPWSYPTASYKLLLEKYSAQGGPPLWVREYGEGSVDNEANSLSVEGTAVYVGGSSQTAFFGASTGGYDVFLAKFGTADGRLDWGRQFGTPYEERAGAVTVKNGSVFVTGKTAGALGGTSAGATDFFVRKY
jgi:hypothetical protein